MPSFASQMAQDLGLMNRQLQDTISSMSGVANGIRTFLSLAGQGVPVPGSSSVDVITPGGVREVDTTPRPIDPYEPATIGLRRGNDSRQVIEAINTLGNRIERTFGGTGGATIRAKGGY